MTYLEAVGRTLAGVAPWLALPDDDTKEGQLRKQMREEALKGLTNAVDPNSPDKINFTKHAQPIVDAAYLAHAFIRAPKALWEPLDDTTKQRYIAAFKSLRNRTGAYNNWLLFTGLTEAFLGQQDQQSDPFRMIVAKNKVKEWYVGDGWYSDGNKFSMDYYNAYEHIYYPLKCVVRLQPFIKICTMAIRTLIIMGGLFLVLMVVSLKWQMATLLQEVSTWPL